MDLSIKNSIKIVVQLHWHDYFPIAIKYIIHLFVLFDVWACVLDITLKPVVLSYPELSLPTILAESDADPDQHSEIYDVGKVHVYLLSVLTVGFDHWLELFYNKRKIEIDLLSISILFIFYLSS